jgi:hypothetical protein
MEASDRASSMILIPRFKHKNFLRGGIGSAPGHEFPPPGPSTIPMPHALQDEERWSRCALAVAHRTAGYALADRGVDTRTLQAFMGHRSIANTVIYTAVADKRIRNIWGK